MKIDIIDDKKNVLLERKELKVKVWHDGPTPSRMEVRKKIVSKLNINKDLVVLDSLKSEFGARESIGDVRVYKTKERVLQVEPKHVLRKNFPEIYGGAKTEEGRRKEEKPEGPAEGKPAEEKKDDKGRGLKSKK